MGSERILERLQRYPSIYWLILVGVGRVGVERRARGGWGGVNGSNLASLQASNHGHPTPPLTPKLQEVLRISHFTLMTEQKDGNF